MGCAVVSCGCSCPQALPAGNQRLPVLMDCRSHQCWPTQAPLFCCSLTAVMLMCMGYAKACLFSTPPHPQHTHAYKLAVQHTAWSRAGAGRLKTAQHGSQSLAGTRAARRTHCPHAAQARSQGRGVCVCSFEPWWRLVPAQLTLSTTKDRLNSSPLLLIWVKNHPVRPECDVLSSATLGARCRGLCVLASQLHSCRA